MVQFLLTQICKIKAAVSTLSGTITDIGNSIKTQVLTNESGVRIAKSGNIVVIELMGYNWDGTTEISIPSAAQNDRQIENLCYSYGDRTKRLSMVKKGNTNTITFLDIDTGATAGSLSNIRGILVYTI